VSETPFRLPDEHLAVARRIAGEHRRRSSCRSCYDRGWTGTAQDNTIILCHKCVDSEKALAAWKEHVQGVPVLWEYYREMYEEPADAGGDAPAGGSA
jgi:hypothetical protein